MDQKTLIVIENVFFFVVLVVAFYQLTKGKWRGTRPSAAEEMTLSGRSIEEMYNLYLDGPPKPAPVEEKEPEPEPQNFAVPQPAQLTLPEKPKTKKKLITRYRYEKLFEMDAKKAMLYDIIWKRKF